MAQPAGSLSLTDRGYGLTGVDDDPETIYFASRIGQVATPWGGQITPSTGAPWQVRRYKSLVSVDIGHTVYLRHNYQSLGGTDPNETRTGPLDRVWSVNWILEDNPFGGTLWEVSSSGEPQPVKATSPGLRMWSSKGAVATVHAIAIELVPLHDFDAEPDCGQTVERTDRADGADTLYRPLATVSAYHAMQAMAQNLNRIAYQARMLVVIPLFKGVYIPPP